MSDNKKVWQNIIIGIIIVVAGIDVLRTIFLQLEPKKPESEYIELYPNTLYLKKGSLTRIGDNIYYETKLIITDKLKSQYPENVNYLIENIEFNCETGHYSRRNLQVFDKENKPITLTKDQIKQEIDLTSDEVDYANNMTLCAMSEK